MAKSGLPGFVRDGAIYFCEHCHKTVPLNPEAMMRHRCDAADLAAMRERQALAQRPTPEGSVLI